MSFEKKLRELRGKKTQKKFAEELGVTKSSYAMYERGERVPRDEVKLRIAQRCGLSVEVLFFEHNEHLMCSKKRRKEDR